MHVRNLMLPRLLTEAPPGALVTYFDGDDRILGIVAAYPAEAGSDEVAKIFLLELASPYNEGKPLLRDIGWPDHTAAAVFASDQFEIVLPMPGGLVAAGLADVEFKIGRLVIDAQGAAYVLARTDRGRVVVNVSTGRIAPLHRDNVKVAFDSWQIVHRGPHGDAVIFTFPVPPPED